MEVRREAHGQRLQEQWDRLSRETLELERSKRYLELQILDLQEKLSGELKQDSFEERALIERKSMAALFSEFRRHQKQSGWAEAVRQTRRFIAKKWHSSG